MKDIKITDNFHEAVEIGKDLFKEKSNIYTDALIASIYDIIGKNMPGLSKEDKDRMFYHSIYDYWVYGAVIGEEFYFNFYKLNDEEKRKYITTREKVLFVNHLNKSEDKYILQDKYETYKRFKEYYLRDVILIENEDAFDKFCEFVDKHNEFVVKPSNLGLGVGVHKVKITDKNERQSVFDSILAGGRQNADGAFNNASASVVIEELIQQSDSMAAIHPHSVNGVRIPTVRVGDKVHIYYPWFKIGAHGYFVTSAYVGTYDAGIDPETGIVQTAGFGEFAQREEYHPDSHIKIKGFQIPRWQEAVELATKLSLSLPTIAYTGWDLALTDKGWCVMEGNFTGDFMWQLMYGRGMKKEFEELIGWKIDKKFWWE